MISYRDLLPEQVEQLLAKLPASWGPAFLSSTDVGLIGISGENNLGIAASGALPNSGPPAQMYDQDVIAGFTVTRLELNPKKEAGERDANADHYVLTVITNGYRLHGPYRTQKSMPANAGIPHWPSELEFFAFVDSIQAGT